MSEEPAESEDDEDSEDEMEAAQEDDGDEESSMEVVEAPAPDDEDEDGEEDGQEVAEAPAPADEDSDEEMAGDEAEESNEESLEVVEAPAPIEEQLDVNVDIPDGPVVCDPLNPESPCGVGESSDGLIGSLYYLTSSDKSKVGGSLRKAKINDYKEHGTQANAAIVMSSINVSPRSWKAGFQVGGGEVVEKENGEKLYEWFHLDLTGTISLPAGTYQFGMRSDDGMRVTLGERT